MGTIRNPLLQKLANTGKKLTMKSNIKSYVKRLDQLNENDKRAVLTNVKQTYHNQNKGNVWSEISREMRGGKRSRKTRKAKKGSRKH